MRRTASVTATIACAFLGALTGCGSASTTSTATTTTTSASSSAVGAAAPLIGTWKATTSGFGVGKENFRAMTWTLEITKAEGSAFEGSMSFEGASNFAQKPERISGVVRADGSVHFVDNDGSFSAIPNGEGTYEMTYHESSADDQTFVIGTLTRA